MRINRLHSDDRGFVASAELILAAPLFLLFWVLMWDLGILQSAKLNLVVSNRTATFMKAQHDYCLPSGTPQAAVSGKTDVAFPACRRRSWSGADAFWSELDRAGRQNITRDVRRATAPGLIESRQTALFRFHPELEWGRYRIPDRFAVMEPVTYTNEDPALAGGYDRVLKDRLSSGHGSLIRLFPGLFPGANR
ncbi:hypothetical protein [Roseibium sp.]|uniref:hypothetical protein n=1 Tax=Roseibium sp. TaxID=1936156 RepID=UPI003BAFD6E9